MSVPIQRHPTASRQVETYRIGVAPLSMSLVCVISSIAPRKRFSLDSKRPIYLSGRSESFSLVLFLLRSVHSWRIFFVTLMSQFAEFEENSQTFSCSVVNKVFHGHSIGRIATFRREAPGIDFPPRVVPTRWGTWVKSNR